MRIKLIVAIALLFLLFTNSFGAGGYSYDKKKNARVSEVDKKAFEKLKTLTKEEIKALDEKLAKALILFYDREFDKAVPIFQEISAQVETMDIMWWLASCAKQAGQLEVAIQKFKEMLAADPELGRVRLELATIYFNTGQFKIAKEELLIVQKSNPPKGVAKNIDNMLTAIHDQTKLFDWSARASVGWLIDDNISAGPKAGIINDTDLFSGAGAMSIGTEAQELASAASVTTASGNIMYDIGQKNGLIWYSTISLYNKSYIDYGKFNYFMTDVSTGPWWIGTRDIVKVPVGWTYNEYANEILSNVLHVDPSYEHHFNKSFSVKGLYSYSWSDYWALANATMDAYKHKVELSPSAYFFNRKHMLTLTGGYEANDAKDNKYSYYGGYYALSYFMSLPTQTIMTVPTNTEIFAQCKWQEKRYLDPALPIYNDRRRDEKTSLTAVISQNILDNYFVSFTYTFADNKSDMELYRYEQNTYTFNVGCKF